MDVLESVYDEQ